MFLTNAAVSFQRGMAPATTVSSGSNGVSTSSFTGAGVLQVVGTTGYQSLGTIFVSTSGAPATITYTSLTPTSFAGCTTIAGGGTLLTGGAVTSPTIMGVEANARTGVATGTDPNTGITKYVTELRIDSGLTYPPPDSGPIMQGDLVLWDGLRHGRVPINRAWTFYGPPLAHQVVSITDDV